MSTIHAAVMTEPGTIELREFPKPRIGDDEILLKVERTGMWAYPAMQFKTALSFLKNTRAPLDEFITHRLSLAETAKGIDVTGSEGSMKVVIEP